MKSLAWFVVALALFIALFCQIFFVTQESKAANGVFEAVGVELQTDKVSAGLGESFNLQVAVRPVAIFNDNFDQVAFEGNPVDAYIALRPSNSAWTAWFVMDANGNVSLSYQQTPLVSGWKATLFEWQTLTQITVPDDPSLVGSYTITGYLVPEKTALSGSGFSISMTVTSTSTYATFEQPEMVTIKAGTFSMGSKDDDASANYDELPQHQVTISKDFSIGKYEVTNAQFCSFLNDGNYGYTDKMSIVTTGNIYTPEPGKEKQPVVYVTWSTAKAYCEWLSQKTGQTYSLPTEAQWEYACRAGSSSIYYWGDKYESGNANYDTTGTTPVGSYPPNAWGLYDMCGNVWEWCADTKGGYTADAVTDPLVETSSSSRVYRGGGWRVDYAKSYGCLRSAARNSTYSANYYPDGGFRVVATK